MNPSVVIAEAGVNHNGSLELAMALVDAAVDAGADIVKFQTFSAEKLTAASAPKASYQQDVTDDSESQLAMLQKLELRYEHHHLLMEHCITKGIIFLSTPFDLHSVAFLASCGMEIFKIPSGEITNLPYLRKVGALRKKIILSTGMSTLSEVGSALDVLELAGTPHAHITLLHCTTQYPAPYGSVNLRAMQAMHKAFPTVAGVGYSDHTRGIEIAMAAVALGATVIEKHFTLDRNMEGPDHKASLEPDELKAMVTGIRHVETALGDGVKMPSPAEIPNMVVARKSIVAARDIQQGEVLTEDNLTTKRPGSGISPMRWDAFIGKVASRGYAKDDFLCEQ